ncbi:MAG: carbohydrate kinase family protein [Lachnospiraceae bacterium]|nr:carbohydrate kinase family protein [Lachnospiraceae bacterium]
MDGNKKKKVIAAGHICLDITPVFPEGKSEHVSDLLSPGKLIQMGNADVHTGGSVANTGLAMKILGANVSLMGKVGADAFGDIVLKLLEGYQAKDGMIRSEAASTSYSVVLAIPGIDRIFLHHSGANDSFCTEDINQEELETAALFHFGYPPVMEAMYKNDGAELLRLLQYVKSSGAATSLDMAAVDANSAAGRADWPRISSKVLPWVDFFVPSVEELCFMLDRPRFLEWQKRAADGDITKVLDIEADIRPLAEKCMELGCRVLLIKCGAPGLYYRTADEVALEQISPRVELDGKAWAGKEGFEKSYIPERILSGTGAGDTSIAAFLTAMLEGSSIEECVSLAAACGASCVAAYDALSGLKPLDELRAKIASGWEKNNF